MRHLFLLLSISMISVFCPAQSKDLIYHRTYPNNSVFIEIGGNSFFFGSLNYERIFLNKDFFYLSGRIGVGYGYFIDQIQSAPIVINGIFQIYHTLAVEVGAGLSLVRYGIETEMGSGIWNYQYEFAPTGIAGIRIRRKMDSFSGLTLLLFMIKLLLKGNQDIILFPGLALVLDIVSERKKRFSPCFCRFKNNHDICTPKFQLITLY